MDRDQREYYRRRREIARNPDIDMTPASYMAERAGLRMQLQDGYRTAEQLYDAVTADLDELLETL